MRSQSEVGRITVEQRFPFAAVRAKRGTRALRDPTVEHDSFFPSAAHVEPLRLLLVLSQRIRNRMS